MSASLNNNNDGFSLVDPVREKPSKPERTGPTFGQKSAKAAGSAAKAIGKGVAVTVSSGFFWLLTVGGGAVYALTSAIRSDNREQEVFEQGIENRLVKEGFKILATDRYGSEENSQDPSKRINFPKSFDRAAIITAERNGKLYDVGAVRREISRSGYKMDYVVGYKDISLKKVPAFSNQKKPVQKPKTHKKPATPKR